MKLLVAELRMSLVATASFLLVYGMVAAQETKTEPKAPSAEPKESRTESGQSRTDYRARTPVRVGYTRPGNPADEMSSEGKIRPMAFQADRKEKIIGGTVYFAVFERTGLMSEGDPWNTGMPSLQEMFSEGYSFQGTFSPRLDTQGRYLYLYQVVNDRGMERPESNGIVAAVDDRKDINTSEIAGYSLRLSVDPRYITSWGFFKKSAFNVKVPNRTNRGEIIPAADGSDSQIAMAVSSYQSVLSEIPQKRYSNRSPAFPLPTSMKEMFGVGPATFNMKMAEDHKQLTKLEKDGVKLVGFEKNQLMAAVSAKNPDFVQILYGRGYERTDRSSALPALAENGNENEYGPVVFRVDFRKPLLPGDHSVVFGFTSDLPPQDEPIRIEDLAAAQIGIRTGVDSVGMAPATPSGNVQLAATGEQSMVIGLTRDLAVAQTGAKGAASAAALAATGIAPGPVPVAPEVGGGGGALGTMGGIPAMGGVGFGGMGGGMGPAAGAIGSAPQGMSGGGGIGAMGGGQGSGQTSNQNQNPNDTSNTNGTTNNINFNATLNNQQQQQQNQNQNQNQTVNGGGCCCCNGGNVVPEPGSIILAFLSLPGLFWFWRKRMA